jgi:hypothetical protein
MLNTPQNAKKPAAASAPAVFSPARLIQSAITTAKGQMAKPLAAASALTTDSGPWSPPTPSKMVDEDQGFHTAQDLLDAYKALDDAVSGLNLTSVLSAPGGSYSAAPSSGPGIARIFSGLQPHASTSAQFEAAGDEKPAARPVASVIAPVTLADFAPFLERTKARTERFFARPTNVPRAGGACVCVCAWAGACVRLTLGGRGAALEAAAEAGLDKGDGGGPGRGAGALLRVHPRDVLQAAVRSDQGAWVNRGGG